MCRQTLQRYYYTGLGTAGNGGGGGGAQNRPGNISNLVHQDFARRVQCACTGLALRQTHAHIRVNGPQTHARS